MELSFVLVMTGGMLVVAFLCAFQTRSRFCSRNSPENDRIAGGMLAIIGLIALFGSVATLTEHVSSEKYIEKPNLRATCNIVAATKIQANTRPKGKNISSSTKIPKIPGFEIEPEENVKAGMGKISEVNSYLKELSKLATIPVGLAFVVLLRYAFSSAAKDVNNRLYRVGASAALVAGSILALLASHNLTFSVIAAQVSILGAGIAFCYDDFATVYLQAFYIIEAAALLAISAIAVLPEGLRLKYSED